MNLEQTLSLKDVNIESFALRGAYTLGKATEFRPRLKQHYYKNILGWFISFSQQSISFLEQSIRIVLVLSYSLAKFS